MADSTDTPTPPLNRYPNFPFTLRPFPFIFLQSSAGLLAGIHMSRVSQPVEEAIE